jgi:hypothetical protein
MQILPGLEKQQAATEFSVVASCPDDDDGRSVSAILRVTANDLQVFVECYGQMIRAARWIPFRGPKLLQWLLTLPCAGSGMLISKGDLHWFGLQDSDTPRLRLLPWVPPEFWCDLEFRSRDEAKTASELVTTPFRPSAKS